MMENLTAKQRDAVKAFFVLVGFIFAGIIYYQFWVMNPAIKKAQEDVTRLNSEVREFDMKLREFDQMMAQMDEIKAKREQLARIAMKLPNTDDAPGFYVALQKILQATRVEYSELRQDQGTPREVYQEIPYHIACRSRYHDFGQFLNLIEENPDRFMRVKSFIIENQDQRPSIHPVQVDIVTFRFITKG